MTKDDKNIKKDEDEYINPVNFDDGELPIRKFNLKSMVPNPTICMIAKRGSGKSWVTRDILKTYKGVPGGIIIAPTDYMNTFYGNFIPSSYIYYKFDSTVLSRIISRQKKIIKIYNEYKGKGKKVDPRIFIVMDDCLAQKTSWVKDPVISEIFLNGRHYHIMYILTMQAPLGMPPDFRANFDYVFLLANDMYNEKEKIYKNYCGMFPSFQIFNQVFDKLTADFSCLVINNRGARVSLLDKIFWFKASNKDIKRFGSRQYNDFHNKNYNEKWDDDDGIDCDQFLIENKKKTIRIGKID